MGHIYLTGHEEVLLLLAGLLGPGGLVPKVSAQVVLQVLAPRECLGTL